MHFAVRMRSEIRLLLVSVNYSVMQTTTIKSIHLTNGQLIYIFYHVKFIDLWRY